jgi:predicted ATPase
MADRITELRIEGLRTIDKLVLPLDGLTVLIGENGSGKSSIIEACHLLKAAARPEFSRPFHGIHGGLFSLLRSGATRLTLGARIENDDGEAPLDYEIVIGGEDRFGRIQGESLSSDGETLLARSDQDTRVRIAGTLAHTHNLHRPDDALLGAPAPADADRRILKAREALQAIQVHIPFETLPSWAGRAGSRKTAMRTSVTLQQTNALDLLGDNLANAYFELAHSRGEQHWQETLDYVRLGLGYEVERITSPIDPGGGAIGLTLELSGQRRISMSSLSDGQLAYLAFVALLRLEAPCSLLAFDEPDLHLHPSLLVRVMQFFASMAQRHPVLIATHSDTALDCLEDPARSTRVCELEMPERRTRVRALDAGALVKWLATYRGVGHIRGEGYLSLVLKDE